MTIKTRSDQRFQTSAENGAASWKHNWSKSTAHMVNNPG